MTQVTSTVSEAVTSVTGTVSPHLAQDSTSLLDVISSLSIPFAIVIVIITAIVNYRSNSNLLKSNRTADHENKISDFRHEWLQELRNLASELIQSIHECKVQNEWANVSFEMAQESNVRIISLKTQVESYEKELEKAVAAHGSASISSDEIEKLERLVGSKRDAVKVEKLSKEKHHSEALARKNKFSESRSNFYRNYSKIKLMFKRDEASAKKLIEKLEAVKIEMFMHQISARDDNVIEEIVNELQLILKDEWEATKNRSWIKSSK